MIAGGSMGGSSAGPGDTALGYRLLNSRGKGSPGQKPKFWSPMRILSIGIVAMIGLFIGMFALIVVRHPVWAIVCFALFLYVFIVTINKTYEADKTENPG